MGKKFTPPDPTGSWNERKDRLKQQFPILTDSDLILGTKNREEMFGNLLSKLDMTPDELHAIIRAL
ncbi:MAG: hypothetical protein KBA14_03935 [Saprospiraceae bacterium]|nr:hypothetical protein [Saprospiraceae bacterium]